MLPTLSIAAMPHVYVSPFVSPLIASDVLWDVATRKSVAVLRGHKSVVSRVDTSPDGGLIASGSEDATVRLWDRRSHEALATINVGSRVFGVAFSPDSRLLALNDVHSVLRLADVATGREVARLTFPEPQWYTPVCFSPDGTYLIAGQS